MKRGRIAKKSAKCLFLGICMSIFFASVPVYAVEPAQRITDREIIESLTRLEEGMKTNREMIVALRTEMGSLRSEMYSGMKSLRDELLGFMKWGFGLIFSVMLILVGFILWDRRSTLKLVKDELDELERRKVDRLIAAMKKLS
jgi:predicted PurR-regulated permease PerM